MSLDVTAVTDLVERVAQEIVSPRFRSLDPGRHRVQGPGRRRHVVDTEVEAALARGLEQILPGVPFVGEEGVAADPAVLGALTAPLAWVVDPLDGTRAFVEGLPEHAVMVALLEHGRSVAGWICLPALGRTYVAERGSGAACDGRPLAPLSPPEPFRGAATLGIPADWREAIAGARATAGFTADRRLWAGYFYSQVADGAIDALLYPRAQPWDHAPGAAIVRELGGVVRRTDGADYRPGTPTGGLVVGASPAVARAVLEVLPV